MLASLLRGATGHRNSISLESATDEAHTRNLLYGHSQHVYTLATSPPPSPFGSPSFRPGSFDDQGGLDLEEKDVRILVAQDAYGGDERPTLLFDSRSTSDSKQQNKQVGPRSPIPPEWQPTGPGLSNFSKDMAFRNRSSTISGAPSSWTRPPRDTGTREDAFLECMFGVTSSTKATSSTKMHIVPGRPKPVVSERQDSKPPGSPDVHPKRAPLARSRTSGQHPTLPAFESETTCDVVLITRLFSVSLPDYAQVVNTSSEPMLQDLPQTPPVQLIGVPLSPKSPNKRPKLVERKVPAFAVGLVLYLQTSSHRHLLAHHRPGSRSATSQAVASASSSYGSDMQSSWTFLDAIPESLTSSRTFGEDGDKRVDIIVSNWDVILRSLSVLERAAAVTINDQLQQVLTQVTNPLPKTPKEKSMQRVNQRIIAIADPSVVAQSAPLLRTTQLAIKRIAYALKIPRVVTGVGLTAGHWTDEARILYRFCGGKEQHFFLFNLLTAFLGNHTQWLERLAPDWYRKQFRAANKKHRETQILASRTVIVSEQKGVARRLIYILASFLPGPPGMDGLQKLGEDGLATPCDSTSSPSGFNQRGESLRRTAGRRARDLQSVSAEKSGLSTSASSADSAAISSSREPALRSFVRKDSESFVVQAAGIVPLLEGDSTSRKTAPGASTPAPTTPIAYISSTRDSYFPEGATLDVHDSIASADLSKILQKHQMGHRRTSSSVSSKWGSLVSGFSDFWGGRQPSTGEVSSLSPVSPNRSGTGRQVGDEGTRKDTGNLSGLQRMVNQLQSDGMTMDQQTRAGSDEISEVSRSARRPSKLAASAPNLKVDDKDGVVDVEVDLPGFVKFSDALNASTPPSRSIYKPSTPGHDGSESVSSLRSIPSVSNRTTTSEQANVGGYLKRYHEDFALHAVKPYTELVDDIKRSMRMEQTPENSAEQTVASNGWVVVCTTLLADTKTFTIRRLTLRRKCQQIPDSPSSLNVRVEENTLEEEFLDETVMEFDTTLADAVEKVLNIVDSQAKTTTPSRLSHTRAASSSSASTTQPNSRPTTASRSAKATQHDDYSRHDHRHVVVGALEDVVKSVNDDLNKQQKNGHEFGLGNTEHAVVVDDETKQENVLREGVKQWLLNVEHTKVW